MPRKVRDNSETPDRVTISTQLTRDRVDNYWKVIGMQQETWMNGLSPSQRYELALQDILARLEEAEGILSNLDLEE